MATKGMQRAVCPVSDVTPRREARMEPTAGPPTNVRQKVANWTMPRCGSYIRPKGVSPFWKGVPDISGRLVSPGPIMRTDV
jgi:hypothetical protein